jgi:hypothetical protein
MQLGQAAAALYGNFQMRVYDHVGGVPHLRYRWRKLNQITNQGRTALLTLMCPFNVPDGQSINRIWSFEAGTNATPPSIDDDETTMTTVWTSALNFGSGECVVVTSPPNEYYLAISKTLGLGDANGSTLREAGIYTRGDNDDPLVAVGRKLYSRQVHSAIEKVGTMTVQYDWQLGITIQS